MQKEHSELLQINDGLIKDYNSITKELDNINRLKIKLESKLKITDNNKKFNKKMKI